MKHLLENPKEYYFQLGMSKEYSGNAKFKRPSKLTVLRNALKRCNMQILEQIRIAQSKEVKRRDSRAQLLSMHPYSKKLEYRERELAKKHDADRRIAEKHIMDLLRKQQRLDKACKKLIAVETTTRAKSIQEINNETSTFAVDMKRWLQDMNIEIGGEEEDSKKCLKDYDNILSNRST